jgi:lipoate-protein ligase A
VCALLREASPDRPGFDIAVSHALLRQVAAGEIGATRRLYRPGATLAFGKLDRLAVGYEAARAAAAAHGFAPVLRLAGGHAAAYDSGSLVYEEILPVARFAAGMRERFAPVTSLLARALRDAGAGDVRVGALPGEYCAGEWSLNVAGRVKVAGVAQRVVRGAALVSAVVVVSGGERIRAALVDVYAELGIEWDPGTAGSVDDGAPGVSVALVESVLLAALNAAGEQEGALAAGTLALAESLASA